MFRIEMLPAGNGDGLWIEYGDPGSPSRLLVDGGTGTTSRLLAGRIEALPEDQRRFELLVVTHIDGDHILGVLRYVQAGVASGLEFGDVWFNGWGHLPRTIEPRGPVDGEELTNWLLDEGVRWNEEFGGDAVVVPKGGSLPTARLPGGLELTLLSPGIPQLERLEPVWAEAIRAAGLDPATPRPEREEEPVARALGAPDVEALASSRFAPDGAEPNGSSIVLLAEFEGKSVLLGADGHATVLVPALDRLLAERGIDRLDLDAFKVSHHGSRANVSADLLERIRCSRFLFSTNGSKTHHPNPEAVARVLVAAEQPATLYFNYRSDENAVWDDDDLRERWEYETVYPAAEPGLPVDL